MIMIVCEDKGDDNKVGCTRLKGGMWNVEYPEIR